MKKILLIAAIVLGFGINAEASDTITTENEISAMQEKEYKPIEPSAIPSDVLKNISSKYGGFTIKEAHVAADGEYKLILAKDEKQ